MGIKEKCTLEEEEKKEVLELAQNHTFGLFIELSLRYGLRLGEIVRLKKCDLHLEKNQIYVGGTKTEKSKRTIRIKETELLQRLKKLSEERNENDFLFSETGHMLTRDMVTRNWKSFTKELSNKELSQLSIHCLRSTFASEMRKRGCSATEIREAMGV